MFVYYAGWLNAKAGRLADRSGRRDKMLKSRTVPPKTGRTVSLIYLNILPLGNLSRIFWKFEKITLSTCFQTDWLWQLSTIVSPTSLNMDEAHVNDAKQMANWKCPVCIWVGCFYLCFLNLTLSSLHWYQ